MLRVGLTGGIGCGKTTATERFAALGAAVLDADRIAHELTAPNGDALSQLRDRFGDVIFNGDGSLNRTLMRQKIFSDPDAKARLEDILHPMIEQEIRTRAQLVDAPYLIIVVPLLLETKAYRDLIDRILVIDCSEQDQIKRASRRSGLTEIEVRQVMACQCSRAARLQMADDTIINTGDETLLHRAVEQQHKYYMALATAYEH